MADTINIISDPSFNDSNSSNSLGNFSDFVIRVNSNIQDAVIYVNNISTGKFTPNDIFVRRDDIIRNAFTVSIQKAGYTSNTTYQIYAESVNDVTVIDDTNFDRLLNTGGIEIKVRKIDDGVITNFNLDASSNSVSLYFELLTIIESPATANINVTLSGEPNSVVFSVNNTDTQYLSNNILSGIYEINDTIIIRSSDVSRFRVVSVTATPNNGTPQEEVADANESLVVEVSVDGDYTIDVVTEIANKTLLDNPAIELLSVPVKTFNIGGQGVAVILRKNAAVTAITAMTSNGVVEFDDLNETENIGIILPAFLFKDIGVETVRLFPVSLSKYYGGSGTSVKPAQINDSNTVSIDVTTGNANPSTVINVYEANDLPVIPSTRTVIDRDSKIDVTSGFDIIPKIE